MIWKLSSHVKRHWDKPEDTIYHFFTCNFLLSQLPLKLSSLKTYQNCQFLVQKSSKFWVKSMKTETCKESKTDNPFGPVCQCCNCLKCSTRSKYCFCSSQVPFKATWHPKPKFRLFFKKGIPCIECKRLDCTKYLLHSRPCYKKSTCNVVYPYPDEWWDENWEKKEATKTCEQSVMRPRRNFKILTCKLALNCCTKRKPFLEIT